MPNDLNYLHASFVNGGFFAMTIHFAVRYLAINICLWIASFKSLQISFCCLTVAFAIPLLYT